MPKAKTNGKKAIASAKASMAFEGLKPSKQAVALGRQYFEGKISSKEVITRVKALHIKNKQYE